MRWLALLLIIPLAFSYQLAEYTGGNVYIMPGKEINLSLPFPEGNNCLPVAVLFVKGGKDYPTITVNDDTVVGGGVFRLLLREGSVNISVTTSLPAEIEGNSLIYCTRDPFVKMKYFVPERIEVGNYNYVSIILTNYGYSGTKVRVDFRFHKNLSPFSPIIDTFEVPPRSKVSTTVFLVSAPFEMRPSAHPFVCMEYNDSIMHVRDCEGPVPTSSVVRPRFACLDGECMNTSNLILEKNGKSIMPGDVLPEVDLNGIKPGIPHIEKFSTHPGTRPEETSKGLILFPLMAFAVVFVVIFSVAFK